MTGAEEMKTLYVLYGSQTGTACEVAHQIGRMGRNRYLRSNVMSMDAFPIQELPECSLIVFVVSTTGDGEAPDNMRQFWKFLLKRGLASDSLNAVHYAVFGLGDSSYAKFNAVARRLETRLNQLGANKIVPRGLGDDQHEYGFAGALDPWLVTLWAAVLEKYPLPSNYIPDDSPKLEPSSYLIEKITEGEMTLFDSKFYQPPHKAYGAENGPIQAILLQSQRMTAQDWEQDVRHLEFQIPDTCGYDAGDIAWIHPENVADFLPLIKRLGYEPNQKLRVSRRDSSSTSEFPSVCTVLELFQKYIDILGTPRRYFFEQMSLFATDEEEKEKLIELCSPEGADLIHDYCTREKRTYLEIFDDFKTCNPPIEYLLDIIPRLQPRGFSIASSHLAHPGKVQLAVAIVDFVTPYKRRRTGVCTSWFTTLRPGATVPLWLSSGMIKLPSSLDSKIIMIGPGTGVAPMRSLIQERHALYAAEKQSPTSETMYLFFGCRHEHKDFIYSEEFQQYQESGLLQLSTAFSRDQAEKIYVQARLLEERETIYRLLVHQNATCYIAGSAKRMPADIYQVLRDILRDQGKLSLKEAEAFLKDLVKKNRYIVESWS